MQVQVNTDSNISSNEQFVRELEAEMEQAFHRFGDQMTRLEIHLGDENSHKSGERDKRCLIEARLAGMDPIAASDHAETLRLAMNGAVKKLEKSLDRALGRLGHKKGRTSYGGNQEI